MERFLVYSKCSREDKESFFKDIVLGFQLNNSLEKCKSLMDNVVSHALDEKQKKLLATIKGPSVFSLTAFLADGIKNIPKMLFIELQPRVQVGDQV